MRVLKASRGNGGRAVWKVQLPHGAAGREVSNDVAVRVQHARVRDGSAILMPMSVLLAMVGEVFDDAATGQGLLNFFLRALNCGAVKEEEIGKLTGLTLEELRSGSFVQIVQGRRH